MRGWTGIHQTAAAEGGGIAENTLISAEKGRGCSDKTWNVMLAYYAHEHGLHWRGDEGPAAIIILPPLG